MIKLNNTPFHQNAFVLMCFLFTLILLIVTSCTPQIVYVDENGEPLAKRTGTITPRTASERVTFVDGPAGWFCAVYEEAGEQDQFICFDSEIGE